ncbi:MAG: hypothetical protein M1318_07280 [Firmicutes bacterium]|nr:hypothetical protein [Bacillota bacterium]
MMTSLIGLALSDPQFLPLQMIKTRLFSLSGPLDPAIHVAVGHTPYAETGMSDRLRRKRPSGQAHACPHRNMNFGGRSSYGFSSHGTG